MTTDEVIKYLEYADDFMRHNADWHDREAIDLAIEALKREDAEHAIKEVNDGMAGGENDD